MRKMKIVLFIWFFLIITHSGQGQNLKSDSVFVPDLLRQYQFQLEGPVQSIENLRYEKSGELIKGTLSPDGKRVLMENYKKGQRVKCNLVFPDGRKEELIKSPCFIDPVNWEL